MNELVEIFSTGFTIENLKRAMIWFFLLVFSFFGITTGGGYRDFDVVGDGYGYQVESGIVEFGLDANATTGYSWTYTLEGDGLKFFSSEYLADPTSELVGIGGTQFFKFEAVSAGTVTITFTYAQQWSGAEASMKYSCVCEVTEDLGITVKSFANVPTV